ncbi:MAG: ABC transporter ATP-binding protein [Phycisphaerales bacterium]|nr:MAG: ABC transporter ATP-binding protein [Phycisphaerales bacterium]
MIRVEELSFSIGTFRLSPLNLEVAAGQYFVLLGPPGSGKTIFLECLCGLKKGGSGRIFIAGLEVTRLQPRLREIGYVPQDYALFPHLGVERNIGFGLGVHGCDRREIASRVADAAELLGIRELLSRTIGGLSGGEKQRVALARALVLRPKVLLLDEPVCALDELTRQDICGQLFRIQRELGLTIIHVSHNLEEAFSVADRAGILDKGVLRQVGTLDELLRRPSSEFVCRFMRCENIFSGEAAGVGPLDSQTRVKVGNVELRVRGRHRGSVKFMIRPEDVLVLPTADSDAGDNNVFAGRVVRWRDYGGYVRAEVGGPIKVVAHVTHAAFAEVQKASGSEVKVVLRPENIHVLPG